MNFLTELLEKGASLTDDKGADWFDKAEAQAREALPEIATTANGLLPEGVTVTAEQAGEVLDELAKGKAPLLRLTSVGFAWVIACLDDDDEAEAKGHYLEHKATFAECNAAIDAAGDAAFDEAKERNDAWEAFKATLATIVEVVGEIGLKVVVALARKAVGI